MITRLLALIIVCFTAGAFLGFLLALLIHLWSVSLWFVGATAWVILLGLAVGRLLTDY